MRFAAQAEGVGGADERTRTADLLITSELLYQLSYVGAGTLNASRGGFLGGASLASTPVRAKPGAPEEPRNGRGGPVDLATSRGLGSDLVVNPAVSFSHGGAMPILPIVDLMILMAWTSLLGAFVLKAIRVTTSYDPSLFGLGPMELTFVAAVLLLFALTLTARTWLKERESVGRAARDRAAGTLEAYSALRAAPGAQQEQGRSGGSGPDMARAEAPAHQATSAFMADMTSPAAPSSSSRT